MTDPSASATCCPAAGHPLAKPPRGRRHDGGACQHGARHRAPIARYPPGGWRSPKAAPSWQAGHRLVPVRGSGPGIKPAPGWTDLTRRPEWRVDARGSGRQASAPRRPVAGPAASAPGNGEGAPSVTARDPAPAPADLPLRQGRAARQDLPRRTDRPCGLSSFPVSAGLQPQADAGRHRPGRGWT